MATADGARFLPALNGGVSAEDCDDWRAAQWGWAAPAAGDQVERGKADFTPVPQSPTIRS
jgi:hypothetical protein